MRVCPVCQTRHDAGLVGCPACAAEPARLDGFPLYAPALALANEGFDPGHFARLMPLEAASFWFQARNELIVWALRHYAAEMTSFLEVGCGTGFVLSGIARHFPSARLSGSELLVAGLQYAKARLPGADLMQMDAGDIPFHEEFDVLGAFDVLEHVREDSQALVQMRNALKPGGWLLLTVPQHAWLWSISDEYACHQRRYCPGELESKLAVAGFQVLRSTSFVTTLLPVMMLSRLLSGRRRERYDPEAELRLPALLNRVFRLLLSAELAGIRLGLDYPVGGTRFVVARKLDTDARAARA